MPEKKRIRLKVAAPCDADWDSMAGDEAMRFCGQCNKSVYQLSCLTGDQIEELLQSREGVCGRFYQRADGTVMTADCSVGKKRRRRKQLAFSAAAGILTTLGAAFAGSGADIPPPANLPMPVDMATGRVAPSEPPAHVMPEQGHAKQRMGKVAIVPHEEVMGEVAIDDIEPLLGDVEFAPDTD